ncbi:MAG: SOS response-associated peptidase [Anaerolineales bacterium]
MCGRFTLTVDPAEAQEVFSRFTFPEKFAPRYNIAPSQPVLVIPNDDQNTADFFVWGLIPMWAKDPAIGNRLINARGETLAEKPAFRGSLKYKRCLILADGFYEWKGAPGRKTKTPFFIHMKDRKPFAFAGLWDSWNGPDGSLVKSCAIITTMPNELTVIIHNRMPVILHPREYAQWLDPQPQTPDQLKPLIKPFPAEFMNAYPVSQLVNTPANDTPELVLPVS